MVGFCRPDLQTMLASGSLIDQRTKENDTVVKFTCRRLQTTGCNTRQWFRCVLVSCYCQNSGEPVIASTTNLGILQSFDGLLLASVRIMQTLLDTPGCPNSKTCIPSFSCSLTASPNKNLMVISFRECSVLSSECSGRI